MAAQGPGPNPNPELAADQHDQALDRRDSDTVSTVQQSLDALNAEIDRFLAGVPVAEYTAAKLNRLLRGFLEREVLPVADRAATIGVDPGPMFGVMSDLLRRYADALERPTPPDPDPTTVHRRAGPLCVAARGRGGHGVAAGCTSALVGPCPARVTWAQTRDASVDGHAWRVYAKRSAHPAGVGAQRAWGSGGAASRQ
jgi:hypothetical protein